MTTTMIAAPPGDHLVDRLEAEHGRLRRYHEAALSAVAAAHDRPGDPVIRGRLRQVIAADVAIVIAHQLAGATVVLPEIRRTNPGLSEVVARLADEHVMLGRRVQQVAIRASELDHGDPGAAVRSLADALDVLGIELFNHLSFEWQAICPTVRRWVDWPVARTA
jgi:hypothetical protein